MKGVLEVFLGGLGIGERVSYAPPGDGELKFLHPGRAAKVMLDDAVLGYLGEMHPREAMERDLNEPCVVSELDLEKLKAYGFTPRGTHRAAATFSGSTARSCFSH